jgi:hypothetical protein
MAASTVTPLERPTTRETMAVSGKYVQARQEAGYIARRQRGDQKIIVMGQALLLRQAGAQKFSATDATT